MGLCHPGHADLSDIVARATVELANLVQEVTQYRKLMNQDGKAPSSGPKGVPGLASSKTPTSSRRSNPAQPAVARKSGSRSCARARGRRA